MKKVISLFLSLVMLLSLVPISAWAAEDTNIKDTSMQYRQYTQMFGQVYSLDDSSDTEQPFDYTVPSDGATVIIFFGASTVNDPQGCANSTSLMEELSNTQWAKSDKVNIVAVESATASKAETDAFIKAHDTGKVIDRVYYNADSNTAAFWYAELVRQEGNMSGVTSISGSMSAAYVLIVTQQDGEKYIRYSEQGVKTTQVLTNALSKYVNVTDPTAKTIEVTVPGYMRYDQVNAVVSATNENRRNNGLENLTLSGQLTELAMQRAAECALIFNEDHVRPNGYGALTIDKNGLYTSGSVSAENISTGRTSAADTVTGWMNSPGHRANILGQTGPYTQIGVGCFENNGVLYWVQLFGTGNDTTIPTSTTSLPADVTTESLESILDLRISASSALSLNAGESKNLPMLYHKNAGIIDRTAIIRPAVDNVMDASNKVIASVSNGEVGTGIVNLTGISAGNGTAKIRAGKDAEEVFDVPVSVTGSSIANVSFTLMPGFNGGHCYEWDFQYSDSYFDTTRTSEYNLPLAKISLGLACAAGSYTCVETHNGHRNEKRNIDWSVKDAMDKMGFDKASFHTEGYEEYGRDANGAPIYGEEDTIGSAFAIKTLADGTPLIVVAVRGGGYDNEWIGNFEVGEEVTASGKSGSFEYHKNFLQSAMSVLFRLNTYIENQETTYGDLSNAKIWITGYSRGAAVANIAAHLLTETTINTDKLVEVDAGGANRASKSFNFSHLGFSENRIYAYTFATPAGVAPSQQKTNRTVPLSAILNSSYYISRYSKPSISPISNDYQLNTASIRIAALDYFRNAGATIDASSSIEITETNGEKYVTLVIKGEHPNTISRDKYIHNTIGFSDFVPMVLMKEWDYQRFGETRVLPNVSSDKAVFDQHNSSRQKTYREIFDTSGRANQWDASYVANDNRHNVFSAIFKCLSEVVGSTGNYYDNNYQDAIMKAIPSTVGKVKNGDEEAILKDLINNTTIKGDLILYLLPSALVDYITLQEPYQSAVKEIVLYKLPSGDISMRAFDSLSADWFLGELKKGKTTDDIITLLLEEFIKENCSTSFGGSRLDQHRFAEILNSKIKKYLGIESLNGLVSYNRLSNQITYGAAQEHYPEVYMSWLLNIDDARDIKPITKGYKVIRNACPTDVYVYDGTGAVIASVVNNVVVGDTLYVTVTEQNEKIIHIPYDSDITAKIVATGEGTMDVTVTEYEDPYNRGVIQKVMYSTLPIAVGQEYSLDVEGGYYGEVTLATSGDELVPTVTVNGDIDEYLICVTFDANDGSETYTTIFTDNYGKIPELPIPKRDGYRFSGWYTDAADGKRITNDSVFLEDIIVFAHWEQNSTGGGGGGGAMLISYSITTNISENGTVTVSPSPAKPGEKVTITPNPDRGYETDTVTVTDKDGKTISVTKNSDGTYTFTMPDGTVSASVTFKEINPFIDVAKSAYYYDAVLWAVSHDPQITNGTSATTFSPDATCTRGQVVTFLWRAAGCPEPTGNNNPFTDVAADAYYYKAVLWAVEKGITKGTGETTFSPEQACTRGQVVTFLHRFENTPAPGSTTNPFTDVKTDAYYNDAVLWAVNHDPQITNGTSATTFSPDDTCTRGQIVTFLYRDMGGK